jgi:hypothetical protein
VSRVTGREWIEAFAARLQVTAPDEQTVEQLLAIAATAAHQSERLAAPIACYLVGQAGLDAARAGELAADLHPSDE